MVNAGGPRGTTWALAQASLSGGGSDPTKTLSMYQSSLTELPSVWKRNRNSVWKGLGDKPVSSCAHGVNSVWSTPSATILLSWFH